MTINYRVMLPQSLLTLVTTVWLAATSTATSTDRNPLRSIGRIQNVVIQTATHRINSLSHFNLEFDLPDVDRRIRLTLEPNHDVVATDTHINYMGADGLVAESEFVQKHHHKVYKGTARTPGRDGAWHHIGEARIYVRRDGPTPLFQGTFSVNHDHHHILLRSSYLRIKKDLDPEVEDVGEEFMTFFRDSDILPSLPNTSKHTDLKRGVDEYTCYAGQNPSDWNPLTGTFSSQLETFIGSESSSMSKRQIDNNPSGGNTGGVDLSQTIGQTDGCPSTRKVALVGVATDCGYTSQFANKAEVSQNVIEVMNSASGVFESSFNISLGVQNITIMPANCPGTPQSAVPWNQQCSDSVNIQDRLNLFSSWRNSLSDTNSHWTLLTKCNTGTAVGLAWVGSACMSPSQGAVAQSSNGTAAGANVVALTSGQEWQVIAHETGHTFGAVHDCDSQACANAQFVASGQCCPYQANTCDARSDFIMNPFSTAGITKFSACTIGQICSGIGRNSVHTNCLSDNRAVQTYQGQQCGNGIVEDGEDCDCGDANACASDKCCDGTTCKFVFGAVCDDANEDCCNQCQFSTAGTVCRTSTSSCDPQEVCPGSSAVCPPDVNAPDGQSCSLSDAPAHVGSLQCASGQCTSRNLQCTNVMGSYTNGNNDTYACDDESCTLRCGSPAFGQNVCYEMQQNLLDGTVCGGGGHCSSGTCQGSDFTKEVGNWVDEHKDIVIGIAVAVGVLLLFAVFSCCCGCMRRNRRSRAMKGANRMGSPSSAPQGWNGPPPPGYGYGQPPTQQRSQSPNPSAWPPQREQQDWDPPQSQSPAGGPGQGLYGNGILGARSPGPDTWPPQRIQQPPQAYWGGGQSSARYA